MRLVIKRYGHYICEVDSEKLTEWIRDNVQPVGRGREYVSFRHNYGDESTYESRLYGDFEQRGFMTEGARIW